MCGYFFVGSIDFILKGENFKGFTNPFLSNHLKK